MPRTAMPSFHAPPTGLPLRRLWAVLLIALLGAGCAPSVPFGERASEANRSMEDAARRAVLLNVLRAAAREPLYFTTVSSVDSRSGGDLELGIDLPFDGSFSSGGLSPTLTFNDPTPRFSVSPQNEAEFYRSMLRPMELSVLEAMLERSYPYEQVLRMLIEEIGAGGTITTNTVQGPEAERFRRRLRLLVGLGLSAEPLLVDATLLQGLDRDDALELIEEDGFGESDYQIVPQSDAEEFDLIGNPGGFRLCFQRLPIHDPDVLSTAEKVRAVDLTCRRFLLTALARPGLTGVEVDQLTTAQKLAVVEASRTQIRRQRRRLDALAATYAEVGGIGPGRLVRGLLAQTGRFGRSELSEQNLGRVEHIGEVVLVLRSPIEMIEYLGMLVAPALRGEDVEPPTILPDRAYSDFGGCFDTQARLSPDCTPEILFRVVDGGTLSDGIAFNGGTWSLVDGLEDPLDRSGDAVSMLTTLTALFTDAGDVADIPRVTVLP